MLPVGIDALFLGRADRCAHVVYSKAVLIADIEKSFLGSELYEAVAQIKANPMQPTLPDDIEFGELGEEGVRWKSNQEDQYLNYKAKIRK